MENKKDGILEILNGEGANSENKIVKYCTYAVSAVTIAALGYTVYKCIKNSKEIEALKGEVANFKVSENFAPNTHEVVDL